MNGIEHGAVIAWPDEWGELSPIKTCDWGDCDNPAVLARYDKYGYGWLPVCAECAVKPELLPAGNVRRF